MDANGLLAAVKQSRAEIVDFRFVDLVGQLHHKSVVARKLADALAGGEGIDGSSIPGFQHIHESDMNLHPDLGAAHFLDPFAAIPTFVVFCTVRSPGGGDYPRDPRTLAGRAEAFLRETGIADASYWGPEAEFFILNHLAFGQGPNHASYLVDSEEGIWNSNNNGGPNLGHRPGFKGGYFPVPPVDSLHDVRSDMLLTLNRIGVDTEIHHHEVATAGQAEIDMKYDTLVRMADKVMLYKYVVKNVARRHGRTATFMPKVLFGENGSGMHVHVSLWKSGAPLFFGRGRYADLSELAERFIGGLLAHAPALLAILAPTTNSYKRLVPGYEAPVNLVYSQRNRSAAIRIPTNSAEPAAKRIEFRVPDPTCNPYLAFSAMLLAGLDGIHRRLAPPEPVDKNIYDLGPEEKARIASVPGSLQESLAALEADHGFLLHGNVFTEEFLQTYIDLKKKEVRAVAIRPHPHEFALYSHL